MLMHEWIKYRDAQIKRAGELGAEPDKTAQAVQESSAEPVQPTAEAAPQPLQAHAAVTQARAADADSTSREKEALLESLHDQLLESGRNLQGRLQALQGRQRQLPMEVGATDGKPARAERRGASETREDLVRRLLDPTLTLREAALLLDVCPTTVRRYTDRGVLSCYRTAGNQRRFRLTDVLDFIERRDRERL